MTESEKLADALERHDAAYFDQDHVNLTLTLAQRDLIIASLRTSSAQGVGREPTQEQIEAAANVMFSEYDGGGLLRVAAALRAAFAISHPAQVTGNELGADQANEGSLADFIAEQLFLQKVLVSAGNGSGRIVGTVQQNTKVVEIDFTTLALAIIDRLTSATGNEWLPIESAPKDGTWFRGRRGHLERDTQWGKTSHVPLYGWCHIVADADTDPKYDLWEPVEWMPLPSPPRLTTKGK